MKKQCLINKPLAEASPLLRRLLLGSVTLLGVWNAISCVRVLAEPYLWLKDLRQDWLQAQAIAAGLPAYAVLRPLAERFIGPDHPPELPMATPHPPFAALLCMPMAALPFGVAAALWGVLQLLALLATGWALYGAWGGAGKRRVSPFALGLLLAFAWHPVSEDMILGQFAIFLNLLLVAAWLALRSSRDATGGAALGVALALKLTGWPIVGWLVLERRWKAVGAAIVTFAALHVASLPVVGVDGTLRYYTEVGAQASAIYAGHERNIAVLGLGVRLFEGLHSPALIGIEAPPLLDAPRLAGPAGLLALAALGVLSVLGARRATGSAERRFDAGFAVFVCASLVANPVAWSSYLVMAAVPLCVAGRAWWEADQRPLIGGALIAAALILPPQSTHALLEALATDGRVPFAVSLVSLLHLAGVLGLAALIVRLSSATPAAR